MQCWRNGSRAATTTMAKATPARTPSHLKSIGPRLDELIYRLAQDRADEVTGLDQEAGNLWAALLRDGPELAQEARDLLKAGEFEFGTESVDLDELAALDRATGVIVMRDNGGALSVQPYESDEDLAAAWSAILADVEPGEPGAPTAASPESDENPT
jgi:hypothetical protein